MATFCLTRDRALKFKRMLVSGKISPEKLNKMNSEERRAFFEKEFGSGKEINALYESKLLLKNQKRGIISWAKSVMKETPTLRDTSIMAKVSKLNKAMNEKELDTFLDDLVEQKVGFQLTKQEFNDLSNLAKSAQEKHEVALARLDGDGKWRSEEDKNKYGMDYGNAQVAYNTYFNDLADNARKGVIATIRDAYKNRGIWSGTGVLVKELGNFVAENSRALKASWDNSFWGRQGRKALSRPATSKLWLKNFLKSFSDGFNILIRGKKMGDNIKDSTLAEIYSRENWLNGKYKMGKKLAIGVREEEFPTSLPEKIPALGRLFKISEVLYETGAMRLRADIADKFYLMAENNNQNLNNKDVIGEINDITNIMTGRGTVRGLEESGGEIINKAFFSAKFAISQVQTATKPFTAKTQFAKKQAAYNLMSLVASTGIIMAMASILWPERVEWDTTSTNFGKIKIGNTWIDLTGGFGSYMVLSERIRRQQYKNTYTGIVTKFNEGYGSPDGTGVFWNFLENKTSPMASVIKDLIKGKTFGGDKPTIFNESVELMTPIILSQGKEAYESEGQASDMLIAVIADGLGFSASSYVFQTNWSTSTSKELQEFKGEVGAKKFKEANEEYNRRVSRMYLTLAGDAKYIEKDQDERKSEITKRKKKIKDDILKEYK